MKTIDETGKQYGLLDVLQIDYTSAVDRRGRQSGARFLCQCNCGMVVTMPGISLRARAADINCGCVMGRLPSEQHRVNPGDVTMLREAGLLKRAVSLVQVYRRSKADAEDSPVEIPDTVDELLGTNIGRTQFFVPDEGESVTISMVITHLANKVNIVLMTSKG